MKESFIYPATICGLYGFINEKSWEFESAIDIVHFVMLLHDLLGNAIHIKFKYIWAAHIVTASLCYKSDNICSSWKVKVGKHCLSFLWSTLHAILLMLFHWLILGIIGVRIHVDNFSREVGQGNSSETGSYRVTGWAGYMIACGVYLSVTSVILFMSLSRAWFSNEIESACQKFFHFLGDPIAYIGSIIMMVPFIACCAGTYLPDYDSSGIEVDANAKAAAEILGISFIFAFLLFNMKAAVVQYSQS